MMKRILNGLIKALIVSIIFLPLGLILNILIKSGDGKDKIYMIDENEES